MATMTKGMHVFLAVITWSYLILLVAGVKWEGLGVSLKCPAEADA